MHGPAEVTAVIPTALRRPALLDRALRSVRAQRGCRADIVVAADVPPETTLPDLGADVRVVRVDGAPTGPGGARNAGAAAATTEWVAFLDDDDTWHPDKLARQLPVGRRRGPDVIVASSHMVVLDGRPDDVHPRRALRPGEDVSEFLCCAQWPYGSTGTIHPSSLLTTAALVARCPFDEAVSPIEDYDFVLHASKCHGVTVVQLADPLVSYHVDTGRSQLSGAVGWRAWADWADGRAELFTPRSAAGIRLNRCLAQPDGRGAAGHIYAAAFRTGATRPFDVAASLLLAYAPRTARRKVIRAWSNLVRRARPRP